jgi:hypothetical protein
MWNIFIQDLIKVLQKKTQTMSSSPPRSRANSFNLGHLSQSDFEQAGFTTSLGQTDLEQILIQSGFLYKRQ